MDARWHVEPLRRWRSKLRQIRYEMLGYLDADAAINRAETVVPLEQIEHYLDAQIQAGKETPDTDTPNTEPNRTELTDPRFEEPT